MNAASNDHDRWRKIWLPGLLLVVAVIFAYQPAWNAGFIWDDDDYVTQNPLLTAPDGLWRIWFSTDSPSQYFPLVYTTFRLEHALWGLNATGYHWVNILLHAVNALLVWRLLHRLAVPGAWLGAAIFALHPVQVESVAWVTELKNVQSLFFFLLALLAWLRFTEENAPASRWYWYGAAILFHALSLFSKTTACTLPAALLLILWLRKKPVTWARLLQVGPFVAMSVAMGLVSIWWERHHQGTHGEIYAMGLLDRFLVAGRAFWFYLGKLLWPTDLTFSYPLWKINPADPLAYLWLLACGALAAAVYGARRFAGRGIETSLVFYVAMLSPLLGFFMLYTFKYTFVADHYQYVAIIGPAALAAAGIWLALAGRRLSWLQPALCGLLLATLGVATWRQSRMYKDLETLWTVTIARNPESFMGHNNLGAIYLGQGKIDEAIQRFHRALEIFPDHGNAHGNLANALMQKGNIEVALVHFRRALELEPEMAKPHGDLAFGLLKAGRLKEAEAEARRALEIRPGLTEARNTLGWVLLETGRAEEAAVCFGQALSQQPNAVDSYYNLGTACLHLRRSDEAVALFRQALAMAPSQARIHNNLGSALLQKGLGLQALSEFEAALKLAPNHLEALNNLGEALLQAGRPGEAAARLEQALKLSPDSGRTHYALAQACFQSGRGPEGFSHLKSAAELLRQDPEVQNNFGWALLQEGRIDEAIERFQAALKLQPGLALAHNNLAIAWLRKGRPRDAIAQYQAFLEIEPNHPYALSDFAWLLATWPEASIRDRNRALELAKRADQLSGGQDPSLLRTLAAAYAENAQFGEAVKTARRALELAAASPDPGLGEALRLQLKEYEAGAPFRDYAAAGVPAPLLRP